MICPVCSTQHEDQTIARNAVVEFCSQCGADIKIHQLLHHLQETSVMKEEAIIPEKSTRAQFIWINTMLTLFKTALCAALILFIILNMNISEHILSHINHSAKPSTPLMNTEMVTLQQMNQLMEKELDLIVDLRAENIRLQNKLDIVQTPLLKEENAGIKQ